MPDEKRLERVEDKIDGIKETMSRMDVTLAAQHVTLEEHQRRSLANEKAIEILRGEFRPVQAHVDWMKGLSRVIITIFSSLAGLSALITLLLKLLGKF